MGPSTRTHFEYREPGVHGAAWFACAWMPAARPASSGAAEKMCRRTPGVMRYSVEPSNGVDPCEGIRGGQLSRRDGGKRRGAVVALQSAEFPRCFLHLGERRGNLGRNAPADGCGHCAESGLRDDRTTNDLCS